MLGERRGVSIQVAFAIQNQRYIWNEVVKAKVTTECLLKLVSLSIGDKSGNLAWPLTYVIKVMFSALVSEIITQEQIAVGASNLVEGLTVWPVMYDQWPRSKGQRSRSQGYVVYQQQERYN